MTLDAGFVVYHHRADGRVFYVGKGRPARAHSKNRNRLWREIVARAGGYDVEIVRRYATDAEARQREMEDMNRLRPAANLLPSICGSRSTPRLGYRFTSEAAMLLARRVAAERGSKLNEFARKAMSAALKVGVPFRWMPVDIVQDGERLRFLAEWEVPGYQGVLGSGRGYWNEYARRALYMVLAAATGSDLSEPPAGWGEEG